MKAASRTGPPVDLVRAAAVEAEQARWIAAHASVPGVEACVEDAAAWIIQAGMAWSNAAVRLRFDPATVECRLDGLLARFRQRCRGVTFWVSPLATPDDLGARLRAKGFRCRKYFPAMYCDLAEADPSDGEGPRVTIEVLEDHGIFARVPHPYFGPISTAIRRFEVARLAHLTRQRPRRVWDLVALRDGVPVGVCTVHLDGEIAGLHDVGVLPAERRQGIGTRLVRRACALVRDRGARGAVLIASNDGFGVYERAGFAEVARFGCWYRRLTPR